MKYIWYSPQKSKYPQYVMPQSHTHLRTLRMVHEAYLQLSRHSFMIRITLAESFTVRNLSNSYRKALSIHATIFKNIKTVWQTTLMIHKAGQ